jgi:DNA helicase-2/ATP-dependent DNA helicase PcrA
MVKYHELSLRRVVNIPARGIGETSLDKILAYSEGQSVTFLEGLRDWQKLDIDSRVGLAIDSFLNLFDSLSSTLDEWDSQDLNVNYSELFFNFFKKIGFIDHITSLKTDGDCENLGFEKRLTPIRIFLDSIDRFVKKEKSENRGRTLKEIIQDYLELFELKDDGSDAQSANPAIQLMTLHASKGLEFDYVFLIGVEEDILPHKVLGLDINEERRLFYVGITRAKKRLFLTRVSNRKRYGQLRPVAPSRFIHELPESLVKCYHHGVRPIDPKKLNTAISDFMKQLEEKAIQCKGLKL